MKTKRAPSRMNSSSQWDDILAKRFPGGWEQMLNDPDMLFHAIHAIMSQQPLGHRSANGLPTVAAAS